MQRMRRILDCEAHEPPRHQKVSQTPTETHEITPNRCDRPPQSDPKTKSATDLFRTTSLPADLGSTLKLEACEVIKLKAPETVKCCYLAPLGF